MARKLRKRSFDHLPTPGEKSDKGRSWLRELWKWGREAKLTDWLTIGVAVGGLIAAYASGLFDAKRAENNAKADRLDMENKELEKRKLVLDSQIQSRESELGVLKDRLNKEHVKTAALSTLLKYSQDPIYRVPFGRRVQASLSFGTNNTGYALDIHIYNRLDLASLPSGTTVNLEDYVGVPSAEEQAKLSEILEAARLTDRITTLSVSGFKIAKPEMDIIKNINYLTMLKLDGCGVFANTISVPPGLQYLSLYGCKLSDFEITGPSSTLSYLALSSNLVNDKRLKIFLDSYPNLRTLAVANTAITNSCLAHIAKLDSLMQLDLRQTQITSEALAHFRPARRITVFVEIEKFVENDSVSFIPEPASGKSVIELN